MNEEAQSLLIKKLNTDDEGEPENLEKIRSSTNSTGTFLRYININNL